MLGAGEALVEIWNEGIVEIPHPANVHVFKYLLIKSASQLSAAFFTLSYVVLFLIECSVPLIKRYIISGITVLFVLLTAT